MTLCVVLQLLFLALNIIWLSPGAPEPTIIQSFPLLGMWTEAAIVGELT